ncbi:MAG: TonB-dependent receptor [Bacteroides sp.]|jgi:TonB-linked SusC/RagA family outer membrane protein|nr:TonB-dependent receptor [Bacteroides sp.]MCI1681204.1 TonB-dependent receptor [Bacteroides sp.]
MKNQIFESKRVIVLLLVFSLSSIVWAQVKLFVNGKIADSSGQPLIGVSILIKGTSSGTVSDVDGHFSLSVAKGNILSISYVGYVSQEIDVTGHENISIVLKEDTKSLEEVVVVGYGVQKKVNLTGSVSSVNANELKDKPVMSTAQAIAGLAPGLSVLQNSGKPGASATVKIRGTGTFSSAGTDPLILIDGLSGNIDDIDPGDIQSLSFLKDAASASIYGNRAANGVILIETKKGVQGKTTITYSGSCGWQCPTELPDFLPSWQYAEYYNMAMSNMGKQDAYTSEDIQKFKEGSDLDSYPNVNHLKWLLESGSGFQHQHNVSIRGGNAKISYNLSVGYRNQEGMTAKTANERMTALFTLKSELCKGLVLDFNMNAYNNKYDAPNGEPQSIEGMIGYAVREAPIYAGKKTDGSFGYQDNYSPEAWLASQSFVHNINRNISASSQLKWNTPFEGLAFIGKVGVTYWTKFDKSYQANTYFDENKTVGPASLNMWSANNTYTTVEALSNYEKRVKDHYFKVLLGTSIEQSNDRSLYGYRNTFPNNYLYELSSGDQSTAANSSDLSEYALLSYFGRINYSFKDRYLVEMNLRYDGSSRFAPKHRWGIFPSVSAGWRISEEKFWKKAAISTAFDNLKIRASYGVLGNQNIGTYPYQQTYSLGEDYPLGNPATLQSGAYIATYNNPKVTWEKTSITDLGLDFSVFNSSLTGTFDYFYKYTSDILASVEVASIMGRGVGQSNVGAVSNKGFEIEFSYHGRLGHAFTFDISPNFTYVKNAVEKLGSGAKEEINNNRIVGEPLGIIYGYETDGLFVDQAEIDAAPEQLVGKDNIKPGYVKYKDISGPDGVPDGKVDANYDRRVLGSATPKFYYGLNLSASYKNFDFSALLQGLGGYDRLIGSYMAYAFYNGGQIQKWQAENCWTEENPNKWAKYPRLETLNMNNANLQTSDYWVRDASFLRIKNVQIGYTLPLQWIRRFGLVNMRVFLSGQNLYSFNGFYKGWDPENEIGTGDSPSYYPINSIYSFGINLKF